MPVVSVVIPTYKRAAVIGNAIASVLGQTFQDFEILVADDASPDDTQAVVGRIGDARIRYLRNETNRGDAAARNLGVRNARGEYVAFLDDDDEWLPEKLRRQVEFLNASGPDVGAVHSARFRIDRTTGRSWVDCLSPEQQTPHPVVSITTSAMMMRRDCFTKLGIFDESIPFCSDADMWLRVTAEYTVGYIPEPLVRYYVAPNSLSTNYAAMSGGEARLLEKHLDRYAKYPRLLSQRYLQLGVWFCNAGNAAGARRAFLRAARWDPLEMRSYFNFALALLGPRGFRRAKAFKQALRRAATS